MTPTAAPVTLVTGAASGIGAATARLLAERGARVVLADRDRAAADHVAADIVAAGGRGDVVDLDVTDAAAAGRVFHELRERGLLAVGLVNSAGVARRSPFLDMQEQEWQALLDINLTGTMRMSQLFTQALRDAGRGGAIVNLASVTAHVSTPNLSSYAATKGAVVLLTRALAVELAPLGVRVNAVSPGYTETALTDRGFRVPSYRQAILSRTPLGRLGTPRDIATVIAFLLSEESAFVTGQVLPVDGGISAGDPSLGSPSAAELDAIDAAAAADAAQPGQPA
ncbi:MAG: SDR family NAD(P)-dependent oxidoreductase [Mycobacteriales bacterium]